jgi:hypothetical protein
MPKKQQYIILEIFQPLLSDTIARHHMINI